MSTPAAVIISARRSATGRIGGLHRNRRVEELAEPVLRAALADARCAPDQVAGLLLGNSTEGARAARAIGLASGLPETLFASTIDSQCGSGLEAIVAAARRISCGEADCLMAGGAESISTAPWRIARPRSPYQLPHFIGYRAPGMESGIDAEAFEADEQLAQQIGISRAAQDDYVIATHLAAEQARERREFVGEIVGARATPEEMRDQVAPDLDLDELGELPPFRPEDGTLTAGNTSSLADAAAFVVVVSGRLWEMLGRPKGLVVLRSHMCGVAAAHSASAAAVALDALLRRGADKASRDAAALSAVEASESSAVEAIALARNLTLGSGVLNAGGGSLVRGQPLGASSAVSVVRLFTRLARAGGPAGRIGAVAQRGTGGIGLAALFEVVG